MCQETTNSSKITWFSFILLYIGLPFSHPPTFFSDNIYTIHLTVNPLLHTRTKNIKIYYNFVRKKSDSRITSFLFLLHHCTLAIYDKLVLSICYLDIRHVCFNIEWIISFVMIKSSNVLTLCIFFLYSTLFIGLISHLVPHLLSRWGFGPSPFFLWHDGPWTI